MLLLITFQNNVQQKNIALAGGSGLFIVISWQDRSVKLNLLKTPPGAVPYILKVPGAGTAAGGFTNGPVASQAPI